MSQVELTETRRYEILKTLKVEWAKLRKGSGATQEEQKVAQTKINELQKELGGDITNFDKPRDNSSGGKSIRTLDYKLQLIEKFIELYKTTFYETAFKTAERIVPDTIPDFDKQRIIVFQNSMSNLSRGIGAILG